jgi:DNA-binding response OmpR family regulator
MTRILLAEHSPHAQRMGERILREEGYTVVTVTDGETAMLRLKDVKPQLVLADIGLEGFSGFEICDFVKLHAESTGMRVVLTLGAMELLDDAEVARVKADGVLRKPFEASALLEMAARFTAAPPRESRMTDRTQAAETVLRPARSVVVLDADQVRAAVTVALDETLEPLIDRVTERVLAALAGRK